jgi:hypothetical protein
VDYIVNRDGTVGWNLSKESVPPGASGPAIENPAKNAARYFYFGMDACAAVDLDGQYLGLFTTSLCGCWAGFFVRTRGSTIRRIVGYHRTKKHGIPEDAIELFNEVGANGPSRDDVNYLIRPDKASIATVLPSCVEEVIGDLISEKNVHSYLRPAGEHVSWVISLDGQMGEMTADFEQSRSRAQKVPYGAQTMPTPPTGGKRHRPCTLF